jgi:hypothetical protein
MDNCEIERTDEVDKYYKPIDFWNAWVHRIFWITACFSVAVLFYDSIPVPSIKEILSILFLVGVISHLGITLYLRLHLIPIAEEKRRRQLLSNSFGVYLTPEKTIKYYNNQITPSIKKLGANVLENAFYAKSVCGKMAANARVKVCFYFIIWIIVLLSRETPLDLLVAITQTVFSGEIIINFFSLEILRRKNEELYNELYKAFLNKIDFDSPSGIACILDSFASYESAKASASLKQSSKIFFELKPQLDKEWDEIKEKLSIDDEP